MTADLPNGLGKYLFALTNMKARRFAAQPGRNRIE